jgi:predicted HTH transcriptional regulator
LEGKAKGYLIWGVRDDDHAVAGTDFVPERQKKGGEDLENWLFRLLDPRLSFRFFETAVDGKRVAGLEVPRATAKPTRFSGKELVRVGSYRQNLKDYPEIERTLWRLFDTTPFEELKALENVDSSRVLALLDYPGYFDLLMQPLPETKNRILECLEVERLIARTQAGGWDITNPGAILFARNLRDFNGLGRKAVRIILYDGKGRLKTIREIEEFKGYACGFAGLMGLLNTLLPRNEVIGQALRREVPVYPEVSVRELVANALIHQDFSITGAGPMIEVFSDRMEITNPGTPLVQPQRFLDSPPRSRNEMLASLMRRVGICEERGSGVDKVVYETEIFQLPAPSFETPEGSTRVVLFAPMAYRDMGVKDKTRACYQHACLRYVLRDPMTNASLRERFGIAPENSSVVSRVIKEAMAEELVKPADPEQGRRHAKYLPYWA